MENNVCKSDIPDWACSSGTELERLQQILFYRELDIPLKKIKQLLDDERDRVTILAEQKKLLLARARRLERLLENPGRIAGLRQERKSDGKNKDVQRL
jgi:DNA-binding transcriptional MerR regulator